MTDDPIIEANRLALMLSTNAIAALARQGLLPSDQRQFCATEMRRVAELFDQAADEESPKMARQLHVLAALLDRPGKAAD